VISQKFMLVNISRYTEQNYACHGKCFACIYVCVIPGLMLDLIQRF